VSDLAWVKCLLTYSCSHEGEGRHQECLDRKCGCCWHVPEVSFFKRVCDCVYARVVLTGIRRGSWGPAVYA
jgi:hypothetical protein